jgi:hypothetical protein
VAKPAKCPTVDEILASVPTQRCPGLLDRWLDADPARAGRFFDLMERGRATGRSMAKLVAAWNAHHTGEDLCPVKYEQVRLKVMERASGKARS